MTRKIRFYNRDGHWYADLPDYIEAGGTESECEMVSGADTWLDFLSKEKDNIFIKLSNENLQEKLLKYEEDEFGATYITHTYKEEDINHKLWLCPVTLFLFNEYPSTIYYEVTR